MFEFKRGIENADFIKELNNNIFFQKLVKDEDLFIAIRNEYLNVYYFGQSICKIEFLKTTKKLKWTTHIEYLEPGTKKGYAATDKYFDKIEELKINAGNHKGKEKEQVKNYILKDNESCILDVEVTFGKEKGFGKMSIDYLAVEKNDDGKIMLVFYEAKHFENSEIRSNKDPKVFEQMNKYETVLSNEIHQVEIINSYKKIIENIDQLDLSNKNNLLKLVGDKTAYLVIDSKPRLIIFQTDLSKKNTVHIEKLKERFTDNRLILREK